MKHFLSLAIVAVAFLTVGCNPEGSDDGGGNSSAGDLIGHWSISHEDGAEDIVFNSDGTLSGDFFGNGTWNVNNGVLTVSVKGDGGKDLVTTYKADMLYDKSVLVLRFDIPATDEQGHYIGTNNGQGEVYFFYREGKAKANDIKDIQGKWYWYMQRDNSFVRAAIIINGDDADVIITVWGERYKGKAQYKDGYLIVNKTEYYTSRYGENDVVNDYLDHPEDAPWQEVSSPSESYMSDIVIDWPFIVNGKEAYGILANLPAVYTKQ